VIFHKNKKPEQQKTINTGAILGRIHLTNKERKNITRQKSLIKQPNSIFLETLQMIKSSHRIARF
jgi:hypothetical protein